jgi:hypothetical protein
MLSGLFFLIFLIGVMMIVAWSVKMERRPPGAPTSGLLAMREPKQSGDDDAAPTSGQGRQS